jgi:tRNA(Glu) U13 pseudouridine synthase TruD
MKLGLVRMSGERVIGVQYFESKFSRELGEILRINGVEWRVGVIADDRNSIIKVLNEIVRIENSLIRKKQRERDREIDSQINQMFIQAYQSVINQ